MEGVIAAMTNHTNNIRKCTLKKKKKNKEKVVSDKHILHVSVGYYHASPIKIH